MSYDISSELSVPVLEEGFHCPSHAELGCIFRIEGPTKVESFGVLIHAGFLSI